MKKATWRLKKPQSNDEPFRKIMPSSYIME